MKINEEKEQLRAFLKKKRKAILKKRREAAKKDLFEQVYPFLIDFQTVLSFSSLPEEIDTSLLNAKLCEEKRLILPKVVQSELHLFHVKDLSKLEQSKYNILEPCSHRSTRIQPEKVDCILVPGLGFDSSFHRLGYGKAHYDNLLHLAKEAYKVGIGFKEQLTEDLLPLFEHDVMLDTVMLF